jgi:hypothetical protein
MTHSQAMTLAHQVSEHTGVPYVVKITQSGWTIIPRSMATEAAISAMKAWSQGRLDA